MPTTPHPDASRHQHLANREPETTSFGAWTLVWVIYGAKVATILLVVWAEHSYRTALFVSITTWFWFGPLLAIGAAPLLFRVRLRRVRARRAALVRSEWITGATPPARPPAPRRRDDRPASPV